MKRERRYLTIDEINILLQHCEQTEFPKRNRAMITLAFRHGFRASELCDLRYCDIEFSSKTIQVNRLKSSLSTRQPLREATIRALNEWFLERKDLFPEIKTDHVFISKRNLPITRKGFNAMMSMIGEKAGFPFRVFPHMLRHACGYHLVNEGVDSRLIQDYLGHKWLNQIITYTKVNHARFMDLPI